MKQPSRILIPASDETSTPEPTASPADDDIWPEFPIIDEPVPVTATPSTPVSPTSVPHISVPQGAAFVLTIKGKNITITKNVDEKTLEQFPGWLDSSCYLFYYTGHAPKKYVVIAVLS